MAKTGDIDTELTLIVLEPANEDSLPLPDGVTEVSIDAVHEGVESSLNWLQAQLRKARPRSLSQKETRAEIENIARMYEAVNDGLDLADRCRTLKIPKEKVVRMA